MGLAIIRQLRQQLPFTREMQRVDLQRAMANTGQEWPAARWRMAGPVMLKGSLRDQHTTATAPQRLLGNPCTTARQNVTMVLKRWQPVVFIARCHAKDACSVAHREQQAVFCSCCCCRCCSPVVLSWPGMVTLVFTFYTSARQRLLGLATLLGLCFRWLSRSTSSTGSLLNQHRDIQRHTRECSLFSQNAGT